MPNHDLTYWRDEFEERAAFKQFDCRMKDGSEVSRELAERAASREILKRKAEYWEKKRHGSTETEDE